MRGHPFKKGHKPWHYGKNYSGMSGKKHSSDTKNIMSWKARGKNNSQWNGGICYRSGYKYILTPFHPNCNASGYVAEHRLVIERKIDRFLSKKENVHHVNGNKVDNRIKNLKIVTRKEHMKIHRKKITEELKRRFKNEKECKCSKK